MTGSNPRVAAFRIEVIMMMVVSVTVTMTVIIYFQGTFYVQKKHTFHALSHLIFVTTQ